MPRKNHRGTACLGALLAGATAFCGALASPASADSAATSGHASPLPVSDFKGVNWADPRDNYADDAVVLSGLSTSDNYATTYAKASRHHRRVPREPRRQHRPAADQPVHRQRPLLEVVPRRHRRRHRQGLQGHPGLLGGRQRQGRHIDDQATYWTACGTPDHHRRTRDNATVYFEPMNEPHGYTAPGVGRHRREVAEPPTRRCPRDRVFISGTGYSEDVTPVCADPRLEGHLARRCTTTGSGRRTGPATTSGWRTCKVRIGDCAYRTSSTSSARP